MFYWKGTKDEVMDHLKKEFMDHLSLAAQHSNILMTKNAELKQKLENKASQVGNLEQNVLGQGRLIDFPHNLVLMSIKFERLFFVVDYRKSSIKRRHRLSAASKKSRVLNKRRGA